MHAQLGIFPPDVPVLMHQLSSETKSCTDLDVMAAFSSSINVACDQCRFWCQQLEEQTDHRFRVRRQYTNQVMTAGWTQFDYSHHTMTIPACTTV